MKKLILFTFIIALYGCDSMYHTGRLNDTCNADGTCNAPALECRNDGAGASCHVKNIPDTEIKRCAFESECFCMTCADKCGDGGIKACIFSDTSVWGSKPSSCECK